jgi:hypothetical protein
MECFTAEQAYRYNQNDDNQDQRNDERALDSFFLHKSFLALSV